MKIEKHKNFFSGFASELEFKLEEAIITLKFAPMNPNQEQLFHALDLAWKQSNKTTKPELHSVDTAKLKHVHIYQEVLPITVWCG